MNTNALSSAANWSAPGARITQEGGINSGLQVADPRTKSLNSLAADLEGHPDLAKLGYTGRTTINDANVSGGGQAESGINPEFAAWMQQKGYSLGGADGPLGVTSGLLDSSGAPLVQRVETDGGDTFWKAAMLAAAGVTAGVASAGSGAGAAAGAGSAGTSSAAGAGALGADTATAAAWGNGAGLGGDTLSAMSASGSAGGGIGAAGGVAGGGMTAGGAGTVGGGLTAPAYSGGAGLGITGAGSGAGAASTASLGGGMSSMGFGDWAQIGSSLLGGAMQSNAAGKAAQTQADATNAATAEQRRQYERAYTDQAPYRAAGVDALGQFQALTNKPTSAADVMADPGYQFGLDQGQQAIDRKIAAAGGRVSGASIKEAARYGTGYAATGYNAADQRRNDRLNRLAALAGIGQTSTQASAAAGSNAANQISGLVSSQGNAMGASQLAQGNIWANTGNQIASLYGRGQQPGGSGGAYSSMATPDVFGTNGGFGWKNGTGGF